MISRSVTSVSAVLITVLLGPTRPDSRAQTNGSWIEEYRGVAHRIVTEATRDDFAWRRLAELTDTFGHRLSGSRSLEDAIDWAVAGMRKDGLEAVRKDPVMVPHWVRGAESLEIVGPRAHAIPLLGLGNSVGTPPQGLEAELLIVSSFAELEQRAAEARGRIVLYNVPFSGYGATVPYRTTGASRAARHGALAALVRSVGLPGLRTPHTGMLTYTPNVPQIPAAAIALEDALRLERMARQSSPIRLRLRMEARMLPDVESANVVAEIRGRELPDEVVVVSGHFDSWDVGTGAIDDGGGSIAAWEVLRLLKVLDLRPRRTIRAVLFTNEENGLRGGLGYRDRYRAELEKHVLMMESDSGVFRPLGFGFSGPDSARAQVTTIASLLDGIGAGRITGGGGGADIGPSVQAARIPAMSLDVEGSKYFLIHHTEADTVDKIDPGELARCAAAMAVMAYVVADLPQRLGTTD
jgi:carboxypeptidase Q